MTMNDNPIPALEQAFSALQSRTASSSEFRAAADQARSAMRAIDEAMAAAPRREDQVLARMTPPPESYLRGRSIAQTREALEAMAGEDLTRALDRKIAARLAADLDALARGAEAAETVRDEKRKPFLDQTRRARDYAQRVAEAPKLFKQVVSQFSADIVIANLGKSAWSRTPRPQGSHVGYDISFDDIVPRIIATQEALSSVRLPGFSKHDFSALERYRYEDTDSEYFGAVIAQSLKELRDLIRNHDERRIVLSDEGVARAVQRAQAVLVTEYNRTCGAIRELLALDAKITATDCAARYPDGAPIFDPAMFPEDWHLGMMSKSINGYPRVALPSLDGLARAAE
jgi:hypothetical protein